MKKSTYAVGFLVFFMNACSVVDGGFGKAAPDYEDRWEKIGVNKKNIALKLAECGNGEEFSLQRMERVDKCMLTNGFKFIDSPYRAHKLCGNGSLYDGLPSCRSLRLGAR